MALANRLLALALACSAWNWTGCSSFSPSQYVSPRVTGRVLDMETKQPLSNVQVRLTDPEAAGHMAKPSHGGQALNPGSAVRTGEDGTFTLASVRTLTVFRDYGWYSVTLAFEKAGYQSLVRSYTLADSTNTPSGEPLVNAGDILLPRPQKGARP